MRRIALGGGEARVIQRLKQHARIGANRGLRRLGQQTRVALHLGFEGRTHLQLRQGIGARTDRGQLLQDALTLGSQLRKGEIGKRNRCVARRGGGLTFRRGKKN